MSINKIKNEKFHTVETVPKSNRKMGKQKQGIIN